MDTEKVRLLRVINPLQPAVAFLYPLKTTTSYNGLNKLRNTETLNLRL